MCISAALRSSNDLLHAACLFGEVGTWVAPKGVHYPFGNVFRAGLAAAIQTTAVEYLADRGRRHAQLPRHLGTGRTFAT